MTRKVRERPEDARRETVRAAANDGWPRALFLQLDDDLPVLLRPDVARDFDAAAAHERNLAGQDVGFHVVLGPARRVGLGCERNLVALDLDQDVIELMPMDRAFLARLEL